MKVKHRVVSCAFIVLVAGCSKGGSDNNTKPAATTYLVSSIVSNTVPAVSANTESFTYDGQNRMITATANGNLFKYTYNGNNQLATTAAYN